MRYLLIFSFIFSIAAMAAPIAPSPASGVEGGVTLRAFEDIAPVTAMIEAQGSSQTDQRTFREFMLGGYYPVGTHWTLGAFYRRAYGLHHDDDWISKSSIWQWDDTNSRGEDFLVLDVTGKILVELLPGKNWVAEFKSRFSNNYFNNQQNLLVRPGLTYFWLKNDAAFMNFFVQLELDIPLNYADSSVNDRWLYAGALYHATSRLDVGGFVANHWEAWNSSAAYLAKNAPPYSVSATSTALMALLIYR